MIDSKDFAKDYEEEGGTFDLKGYLLKILGYWHWFTICWAIGLTIAYQVNIRKEKIFEMKGAIAIKEQNNPFFSSSTNLIFNWGGGSDQLQGITSILKSRTHNETVVDKLHYYIQYLKQGEYNIVDAYGDVPFYVKIDKIKNQALNNLIKIKFITATDYVISINFVGNNQDVVDYNNKITSSVPVNEGEFKRRYKIGQQVTLPFLNWNLQLSNNPSLYVGKEFFVKFQDFDATVASYQGIDIISDKSNGSLLEISLQGNNKARMVDYINTTVEILRKSELDIKNQFATNTIAFIDSTLIAMESKMDNTVDELKNFRMSKDFYKIEAGGKDIANKLLEFDLKKEEIDRKLSYYNSLRSYLKNNSDFSKLPAPSIVGIEDPNIASNVTRLIQLSIDRLKLKYTTKYVKRYEDFDNEMESIKRVLLENIITAKAELEFDLKLLNNKINKSETDIKNLPEDEQNLLKIQRKYSLIDNLYASFLAKKSEATIVRASNVSDIKFLDKAKDIGGGLIGPKTGVNYVLALGIGLLLPLIFVSISYFLNDNIFSTEEIKKLTALPLIGVIGLKTNDSNLSVFEKPKSALAESFRAVRSSLQFLYKKQNVTGSKVLMLTSSVSGEGKTFCSINIATVFALSEKKTIIVGLDLRKPKIFEDFAVDDNLGAVNFLIGQNSLDEVIQKSHIPNLDILLSGPVPPNPSELIMGDSMKEMMEELKKQYDYIILDTPPVGLVSDAIEIATYADLTLYIIRQDYTKKEMITLLNTRISRGELVNVSIILNGFVNNAKFGKSYGYGYGYGYSYGYGYGNYSKGYHEDEKPNNKLVVFFKWIAKKISKDA